MTHLPMYFACVGGWLASTLTMRALALFFMEKFMSSFFSNLISWAKKSPAVAAAKQEAIDEITEAANNFVAKAVKNAPDMQAQIELHAVNALTAAITGALTKSK